MKIVECDETNPDIANRQRRRKDAGRRWTWTCDEWEGETLSRFYQWVSDKDVDLEQEVFKLQRQHDALALEIGAALRQKGQGGQNGRSWPVQLGRNADIPLSLDPMLRRYEALGQALKIMRHVRGLMARLHLAAALRDDELPRDDAVIMHFYEEFLKDAGRDRRGEQTHG